MFSNLRQNSQIYILHKGDNPYIEVGSVVSVSQPVPRFPVNNFGTPQELVVDLVVKVNDNDITLKKLPANLDIADQGAFNESIVITTSREAMNAEVDTLRQKSLNIINSKSYHEKLFQDYEVILQKLNPEFAEQKQQKQEIDMLKQQMSEVIAGMKDIVSVLKKEDSKPQ